VWVCDIDKEVRGCKEHLVGIVYLIVFALIKHWDKHMQMRQQFTEATRGRECHCQIAALSPFGEVLIEWGALHRPGISQGLEEFV
jgi:hypothetical protein